MSEQVELIKNFYDAFHQRDWKTMGDCYADNARFHDPVFNRLLKNAPIQRSKHVEKYS
jgi:ketosteroid isomerase-like protein